MKRVIGAVFVLASLVGCATPQQNAALTGAVVGAAVMSSVYAHPQPPQQHHHYHHVPRPVHCSHTRTIVGYDYYNRPILQTYQVCR